MKLPQAGHIREQRSSVNDGWYKEANDPSAAAIRRGDEYWNLEGGEQTFH